LTTRWRVTSRAASWSSVGGAKPAELGQRLRPDRLPGVLDHAHLGGDLRQALHGIRAGDRQRGHHPGDLVAERSALVLSAHAHRHERFQLQIGDVLAAPHQVPAQCERDHGQHDIIDRPTERVLDRLDVVERRAYPCEAPVGPDLAGVVGG
jgi:hypothetical protein